MPDQSISLHKKLVIVTHQKMKIRKITYNLSLTGLLSLAVYSCSKDDTPQPVEPTADTSVPFTLTQEMLDAAIFVSDPQDTLFTGNPFGQRELAARNNYRSIFSTSPKSQPLQVGDINAIRAFSNLDGEKGALLFVDVMVKREAGYNPQGNDFEYIRIPFDSLVDYQQHPNGVVPDLISKNRGLGTNILSVNCVNCHRSANDFIFYN